MTKHDRKLFQNLYKLASFHAATNRLRFNNISATEHARVKADGLASAYEYIVFMLDHDEILASTDCDKANNRHTDLPSWMDGDAEFEK